MIYFLNTDISDKKAAPKALQNIFGVGKKNSIKLCKFLGLSEKTLLKHITVEMKNRIVAYVETHIKNGDELKQILNRTKERQIKIKCYKGQRAKFNLPRRGQRTRTNAKTVKKLNK
jgi:small subunit ribosomal protein S13